MNEQVHQRTEVLESFDSREACFAAILLAKRCIGWPAFVSFLILVVNIRVEPGNTQGWLLALLAFIIFAAVATQCGGVAIGWIAHYLFRSSSIPPARVAAGLALIFDLVVFGWILVLFLA